MRIWTILGTLVLISLWQLIDGHADTANWFLLLAILIGTMYDRLTRRRRPAARAKNDTDRTAPRKSVQKPLG